MSSRGEIMQSKWMNIFYLSCFFKLSPFIQKPLPLVTFLECHRMPKCLLKGIQQDSEICIWWPYSRLYALSKSLSYEASPRLQGPRGQDCPNHLCTLVWPGLSYGLNEWSFRANKLNGWLEQDRLLTYLTRQGFMHQRVIKNARHWSLSWRQRGRAAQVISVPWEPGPRWEGKTLALNLVFSLELEGEAALTHVMGFQGGPHSGQIF